MKNRLTTEDVLGSLEGIRRAEPSPFLFTRIQARMSRERETPESVFYRFISKPSFALSLAFLFLFINGYVLFSTQDAKSAPEETANLIAAEYSQFSTNPYELNDTP